jgi:hypothetical protein
LYDLKQEPKQ